MSETRPAVSVVRLGDLLVDSCYGTSEPSSANGNTPIVGIAHIRGGRVNLTSMSRVDLPAAQRDSLSLRPGDILITRTNSPDLVGRAGLVTAETEAVFASYLVRLRVDTDKVDPAFLNYWLNSPLGQRQVSRIATRAIGQSNVNPTELRKHIRVPLPPIERQRELARALHIWDRAVSTVAKLVQAKDRQYGFLVDRLTADTRNQLVRVRSIAQECSARNGSAADSPVLSVTNRKGFELPGDRFSRRVASEDLSSYKMVRRGQFAYNPSRLTVGSIGRLDGWPSGLLSPMYVMFSLDETKIESDYFLHWLRSSWARGHIARSTQGSVRDSVGFSDFGSIGIHLPTLEGQRQAARVLTSARLEIDLLLGLENAYGEQRSAMADTLLAADSAESKALA